jgi:organic radical activating enzyme
MQIAPERLPANHRVRSKARIVAINVNNRCPLRCRHCSVGFSEEYRGNARRISPEALAGTIAAIDPRVYDVVAFAGGEPSLEPTLLRVGIAACKARGLLSAIVTAPIWASSRRVADRFLDAVPGLNQVIISYDNYHLEFLKVSHYENATRAAFARGIAVIFMIAYTEEAELLELTSRIAGIRHVIQIGTTRTVPIGNAARAGNVRMGCIPIESEQDLVKIPRGCILGTVHIDDAGTVHGCCFSRLVEHSPFSVPKQPEGLAATLRQLEESALFQSVRTRGFIDALTPKGREALTRLSRGRAFANECHLCLTAMKEGRDEIWEEYLLEGGAR